MQSIRWLPSRCRAQLTQTSRITNNINLPYLPTLNSLKVALSKDHRNCMLILLHHVQLRLHFFNCATPPSPSCLTYLLLGSISNIDDTDYSCNKSNVVRKVISGVVGAASSVTSIQVANLLRLFKIPQVSERVAETCWCSTILLFDDIAAARQQYKRNTIQFLCYFYYFLIFVLFFRNILFHHCRCRSCPTAAANTVAVISSPTDLCHLDHDRDDDRRV